MGHDDQPKTAPTEGLEGFPVLRHDVAGIDVGSEQHWVCAPAPEGTARDLTVFAATTPGVEQLIASRPFRHLSCRWPAHDCSPGLVQTAAERLKPHGHPLCYCW